MCPGEEAIAAFAEGRLAGDERDAFEAHLDTCSGCTELVALLAKVAPRPAAETSTRDERAADADILLAGQLGRYVLLSRIGAGGMGVVYAAYDPELDRRVALKLLRHAGGIDLRDEARAVAKLSHPNVVAVHDVGVDGAATFVAMEFIDGTTLAEWLRERRTPAAIVDVFRQAGRGLAAAHAAGLVHRDVKPSNIMIGSDGRARVLDFGLAAADRGGTPAYMAPEQKRGVLIDARADQYALCVALWEALTGERPEPDPTGTIAGVSERVVRALRRGLAAKPAARFQTLDELLRELEPPRSKRPWIVVAILGAALAGTVVFAVSRERAAPTCALAGEPVAAVWNADRRAQVAAAFGATKLPYAAAAADSAAAQLDGWAARWRTGAEATCRATMIDAVQPTALHALRQACLDQVLEQLRAVVGVAAIANPAVVARADALVAGLPAPERCDDAATLGAIAPPPEAERAEVAAVRTAIAELEAARIAGRDVTAEVTAVGTRADATGYAPLRARALLLASRVGRDGTAQLHAAARLATGARDLGLLAEIWIELTQVLGNDQRTLDEARVFDGYAEALAEQLPDRSALRLKLEHARCNRNGGAAEAAELVKHCAAAIELAEHQTPPVHTLANADRTRLGHFQRLSGHDAEALATLNAAVSEAVRVFGPQHPDTAIARYALGIALIAEQKIDAGVAELRTSLAIRRAGYPGGSIQVAESLQGLGDALGASGKNAEAIPLLEEAVAMLDRVREGDSVHAVNSHMLLGMSLEAVHRDDDALVHYVHSADIADKSLAHGEALAAMALRLAAGIEANHDHAPAAMAHLERALHILERGHATPGDLGRTQYDLAEVAFALHDPARARAMAEAARASFVAANDAEMLPETDKFLREHHWR